MRKNRRLYRQAQADVPSGSPSAKWDNKSMRDSKTISREARSALIEQLQEGHNHEIRAYFSELKQSVAKYDQPLQAGRRVIDDAMKTASITEILRESREQ
jgi:ribonuclease HII